MHRSGLALALAETQRDRLVKLRTEKELAEAVTLAGPFISTTRVQRGRGRERRRGRGRLGKSRTKTHDFGYRLFQSDRSIGSALLQHASAFP